MNKGICVYGFGVLGFFLSVCIAYNNNIKQRTILILRSGAVETVAVICQK